MIHMAHLLSSGKASHDPCKELRVKQGNILRQLVIDQLPLCFEKYKSSETAAKSAQIIEKTVILRLFFCYRNPPFSVMTDFSCRFKRRQPRSN